MIVRIDDDKRRTHGWQARAWTVYPHYLSRLFSDKTHGGIVRAKRAARQALPELQQEAARARRQMSARGARAGQQRRRHGG